MNEVKQAVNGYVKPLETLTAILKASTDTTPALDVIAICKQIEEITGVITKTLVAKANAEYKALGAAKPGLKQWEILGGEALVSKYGAKSTWLYTPATIKLEVALAAQRKEEQVNGKAKKLPAKEDPLRTAMYAVTLKQLPLAPAQGPTTTEAVEPISA